jgi:molybdenum cofactor synthesis domain-containing protein
MVLEPESYVSVGEALTWVLERVKLNKRTELVAVRETYGRVLAEDITAEHDFPPGDTSHMDGYAVMARDVARATESRPAVLKVVGNAKLGVITRVSISSGETVRVPTGGAMPHRADAVVPLEWARSRRGRIIINRAYPPGHFVYPAGTDIRAGSKVLRKGAVVRAQDVGLLIHLRRSRAKVFAKPIVAIIATGNELTDDLGSRNRALVRNSHSQVLARLIGESGGEPLDLGIAHDTEREIAQKVTRAIRETNIILTLGGTSLGKLDLVERTLRRFVSGKKIVHGIKMDRGRVAGIAVIRGKPVIMLPGPIQGAINAFVLFAMPLIRAFSGRELGPPTFRAVLAEDWEARKRFSNFTKVVYIRLKQTPAGFEAFPVIGDTESMTVLTDSNAFMVVPEERTRIDMGETVQVSLLPGFSYAGGEFLS